MKRPGLGKTGQKSSANRADTDPMDYLGPDPIERLGFSWNALKKLKLRHVSARIKSLSGNEALDDDLACNMTTQQYPPLPDCSPSA